MPSIPSQRWLIADAQPDVWPPLMAATGLPPLLAQVLVNRGIRTPEAAIAHLEPDQTPLPDPADEFTDLNRSVTILADAIASAEPILICGDYDADGMTSTGLLIRALRQFGAQVSYAIPSRMQEGYGINRRMVVEAAENCVGVILTVDNGIAALEPIQLAIELGLSVIVTDHHDIPDELPPADAILNPKLLPEWSPYRGLAGVGIAYLLAMALGDYLAASPESLPSLLELCTLGTIADLAALTGINRRWVKQGLRTLPQSELAGIQALMKLSGSGEAKQPLRPEEIGFRLGPRINAVGRIGDPVNVIELLTTDDPEMALEQATHCENTNNQRQQLCKTIEAEAHEVIANTPLDPVRDRVLVVYKPDWHHGVIGIVASRLVERYGVPVFICTQEGEQELRGSARGIPEFDVYGALKFCADLLPKYGGHPAAGGFTCPVANLPQLRDRLRDYAHATLELHHLKPLVSIDMQAHFSQLTPELYDQIESMQPWGVGNPTPVFWSAQVQVLTQKTIKNNHLKVTFAQDHDGKRYQMRAIAWNWGEYQLPQCVDIAYKLSANVWQGKRTIELELVGVRCDPELLMAKPSTTAHIAPRVAEAPSAQSQPQKPKKSRKTATSPPSTNAAATTPDTQLDTLTSTSVQGSTAQTAPPIEPNELVVLPDLPTAPQQHQGAASAASVIAPTASTTTAPSADDEFADRGAVAEAQASLSADLPPPAPVVPAQSRKVQFRYRDRVYECSFAQGQNELRIRNAQGKVLAVQKGQRMGLLGESRGTAEPVDVTQPHYYSLIKTALAALNATE